MRTQRRRPVTRTAAPAAAPEVLPAATVAGLAAAVADYLLAVSISTAQTGYDQAASSRLAYASGSLAWLGRQGDTLTAAQVSRVALDLADHTPLEVLAGLDRGTDDQDD